MKLYLFSLTVIIKINYIIFVFNQRIYKKKCLPFILFMRIDEGKKFITLPPPKKTIMSIHRLDIKESCGEP